MQFRPDLAEKILAGEKTNTRRLVKRGEWLYLSDDGSKVVFAGSRTKWRTGKTYAIQPGRGVASIGRFTLLDIRRERVGAIAEADAIAEGFGSTFAFFEAFESINGKQAVESNPEVWVLVFEVIK